MEGTGSDRRLPRWPMLFWRAPKLFATTFLAAPALRVIDVVPIERLKRKRSWTAVAFILASFIILLASFMLLAAFTYGAGLNAPPGGPTFFAELSSHLKNAMQVVATRLQSPFFVASTAAAALGYLAARARQLGRAAALNRVTWPEQVAAADRATFGGIILGNGGTGKTTLADYLYQDYLQSQLSFFRRQDLAMLGGEEFVTKYYESKGGIGGAIAPYRVTGATKAYRVGYRCDLIDTPGQAWRYPYAVQSEKGGNAAHSRKITAWSEKIKEVMQRDHCLIINVMSWGHSAAIRRNPIADAYTKANGDFRNDDYLRHMREAELGALRCAIADIGYCINQGCRPAKLTFVNLVNMAGFWWDDEIAVRKYYEEELRVVWDDLNSLYRGSKGSRFLLVKYVPVSLLFDDLTTDIEVGKPRRTMFAVDARFKADLKKHTVKAIDALERAMYGYDFRIDAATKAAGANGGSGVM